jgi:CheY-like chemotaxis protein
MLVNTRQQPARPLLLIVEDDLDLRESLALLFSTNSFEVKCAAHGQQALRKMSQGAVPDLVITDLSMPVMDGWQMRQEMLQNENLERVPVIVLSAQDGRRSRDLLQAVEYLRKPADSIALLKMVRAYTK